MNVRDAFLVRILVWLSGCWIALNSNPLSAQANSDKPTDAAVPLQPRNARVDVGLQKQLFVDDFVVSKATNLTHVLGQVTKANGGRPIFTSGWFYGTVLHDAGRFKLWYRHPGSNGFGYAESLDGLEFITQTDLKGIKFAGDYTLAVEIDRHESDPEHRFKASFDAPGMAAGLAHSADGIHWTPYHDGQPVTKRAADTYNQILWDPLGNTYRLLTRTDFGSAGGSTEIRGARCMTNRDPKANPTDWSLVREWIFDKEGTDEFHRRQIYSTTCWIYEGVYFALLSVYEYPGDLSEGTLTDLQTRHERDIMNFYLATSRDGDQWDLRWVYAGQPIVPRGPDGAFDKDLIMPSSTIVTHADQHWIYYAGANERHGDGQTHFDRKHAIGLAHLRLDGFVGLKAGETEGMVLTKPFVLTGDQLSLNIDARGGQADVEIVLDGSDGTKSDLKPISGFHREAAIPIVNRDDLRWRPNWELQKSLSDLRHKTVRLKISLRNATLYSFQVEKQASPE